MKCNKIKLLLLIIIIVGLAEAVLRFVFVMHYSLKIMMHTNILHSPIKIDIDLVHIFIVTLIRNGVRNQTQLR